MMQFGNIFFGEIEPKRFYVFQSPRENLQRIGEEAIVYLPIGIFPDQSNAAYPSLHLSARRIFPPFEFPFYVPVYIIVF